MFVKKFEAPSLEQALKLVKAEMGPEALVLSTQEKRSGKLFSRRFVEVTAAVERKAKDKSSKPSAPVRRPVQRQMDSLDRSDEGIKELELYKAAILKEAKAKKNKPERYIEMDEISEGATNRGNKVNTPKEIKKNENLKYEAGFKAIGICPERAIELAKRMLSEFSREDLADYSVLNKAKIKLLSTGIRTMSAGEFFKKRAWVPIGTAGVGKTTLLVKLAIMARENDKSVSLISMDNRKISGRGELASYARIVKAPFFTEINQAPQEKLKFIDSPAMGLNHENHGALEKLCAEKSSFLVLDSSARLSELMRQVDRAMHFHPEAIAFTKVDNVEERGVIYDVLKATQLPLVGLSLSASFKTKFRFITPVDLAQFFIKD